MKRFIFSIGAVVLTLAALMWTTALISAPRGGGHGGGHGGAHAPAHVGSVHYAARAPVARVAPAARAGAVRSEHYANLAPRGDHRIPYRDDYIRRFRPGYRSLLIGGAPYYYYDELPPAYQTVVIGGVTYYVLDGVYYQAYLYDGQTVFLVVPAP